MRGRNQRETSRWASGQWTTGRRASNATWVVMVLTLAGGSTTSETARQERNEKKLSELVAKNDARLKSSAEPQINDVCPITGDTVQPQFVATCKGTYEGRKVAFCCEHCLREFRDADEAGKDAIAVKAFAK